MPHDFFTKNIAVGPTPTQEQRRRAVWQLAQHAADATEFREVADALGLGDAVQDLQEQRRAA